MIRRIFVSDTGLKHSVQRIMAIVLCLCLLATVWVPGTLASAESAEEHILTFLHLPVVEPCAESPTKSKTAWSCVYFGAYPAAEVVDSGWNAVDDYALQEGDVIRDDALYARLAAADWLDGMTELDGVAYYRVGLDQTPAAVGEREQHYRWEYARPWHYFMISPLRWRVLDVQEEKALLLADRMPDSVPFHEADENVSWGESMLRSWLNGYSAAANKQGIDYTGAGFIDRAFTPEQREAIVLTSCVNLPNQDYGTDSGADTEDRLFILSNAEVFEGPDAGRYGFDPSRDFDDPAKRFTSTVYAKCMGAWWSPVAAYAGNSFWFMRTNGYTPQSVTYVCDFGYIYSKGTLVTCGDAAVLPALWVDLGRAELTDAGETVSTAIIHAETGGETAADTPEIGNPVRVQDSRGGTYTVWNAVTFGHYPQTEIVEEEPRGNGEWEVDPALFRALDAAEENDGEEVTLDGIRYLRLNGRWFRYDPIVWRVLEVADGTALLLSDRCLDSVPYHMEYQDVFWEDSSIRQWLNGSEYGEPEASIYGGCSFIEMAFTEEERQAIAVSVVSNANNYYFGTACGSGTHDRVFLLSEEEVFSSEKAKKYGFYASDAVADTGRRMSPTPYAVSRGAWVSEQGETAGVGFWLLRTNGYTQDNIVYVGEKGYLYNRGIPVKCSDAGIVPAIRLRLGVAPFSRVEDISTQKEIEE